VARIAVCVVWAGFWAARVLLTDAPVHFNPLNLRAVFSKLLGSEPVDQAFSICMIWLSVEVAVIVWSALKAGGRMLIAKTTPSFKKQLLEALTQDMTPEELEAIAARMRKAREEKAAKKNGKQG